MKRLLTILLCFCLLFSAAACTQDPEKSYEKQKSLYDGIIAEYTALLTAKQNGEELPAPDTEGMDEREAAIATALHGIVNDCKDAEVAKNLGYGYKDMDGNGTPELILLSKHAGVKAIFTISDKKPLLLEANYGKGGAFLFGTDRRFFIERSTVEGNIEESIVYIGRVDGDKMAYISIYGGLYDMDKKEVLEYFQIKDGERTTIDKETHDELHREYGRIIATTDYGRTVKLLMPYIHLPLVDKTLDENLPVADFSSYAAIRETYKAISTCLEKFDHAKWLQGEYDDLFTFPNDVSFEYYTQLLYTAYRDASHEGYDEIDLNGDGQDELVIMNEDYTIKAIFTQRNGKPVLLDAFFDMKSCWLDEKGLIHVDRTDYYELEYSLYELTKDGDYRLVYSILAAENGNRYLTRDGKTEIISFEDSLTLYHDEYCCYSEPFSPNEYTRNVSSLTYTPLVEPKEDLRKAAVDITWHKYANLEETSDKDWAYSNTYVTFDNATDTQMDMNVRYAFTFLYPDPDGDNSLLDDTAESNLKLTASNQDGVWVFEGEGVKGHLEFGQERLWIIFEESSDQRFPAGAHCYFAQEDSEDMP